VKAFLKAILRVKRHCDRNQRANGASRCHALFLVLELDPGPRSHGVRAERKPKTKLDTAKAIPPVRLSPIFPTSAHVKGSRPRHAVARSKYWAEAGVAARYPCVAECAHRLRYIAPRLIFRVPPADRLMRPNSPTCCPARMSLIGYAINLAESCSRGLGFCRMGPPDRPAVDGVTVSKK
jgi:hypothetical protein